MNLATAKEVMYKENDASIGRLILAAGEISKPENEAEVSYADLLQCLRRGNSLGRITPVDELAVAALYARSKRPRKPDHKAYDDLIVDERDWKSYLISEGLLKEVSDETEV